MLTIQLDVLFAYANANHKNAVKLSLTNDVPTPGSREAEAAAGNTEMTHVDQTRSADVAQDQSGIKQTV